jgi:hypothetical protein
LRQSTSAQIRTPLMIKYQSVVVWTSIKSVIDIPPVIA